ncbi:transcription/translation regulatory transformer protein RfaH [Halopseudomonas litoralis]|uniref:transcription/translation regulatory transformer protein RfaH n=1 Tax=Halopseudomonas litoralis TaxID=797277 RepID=UPI001E427549|nr:transcription/translation regulatory transformer protein RfaH [Halopseudomonas litoralis]
MANDSTRAQWYLIQCKPRQEARAEENLRNQHFPCYCPFHTIEKIQHGRRVVTKQPLFPGYLFINLCKLTDNWHSIRSTRGVLRMVTFAGEPLAVADEIIENLRTRLASTDSKPLFEEGGKVTVTEGPFKDLDAVFCKTDGNERAIILLTMLHREHQVRVPLSQLKTTL